MHWEKVVTLELSAFGEGRLVEESMCQLVFLIPKGKGYYHGIGLVELERNVVATIINCRLTAYITYHELLHGLRAGCSTGTATLKAKLIQQLAAMREDVIYMIFLDLKKSYDALDRDICLVILEGYGIGTRSCRILQTYWGRLRMFARAGSYYGKSCKGFSGVT